eukprot:TRINITY_DN20411_c0_g1_i1.p1 TRINITY_DN20411_c0_g1~~TRINITY_DN20411_c0_g1_i1.p1  ORF type:complete len:412 (+),score=73.09 TRINITY_DN20411_c0_g1_i1:106-1341(+)
MQNFFLASVLLQAAAQSQPGSWARRLAAPAALFQVSESYGAKGGPLCGATSHDKNVTPLLQVCHCGDANWCASYASVQLLGMATSKLSWAKAGSIKELPLSPQMWQSRRFLFSRDSATHSQGPGSYTVMSDGMGVGKLSSGVYAGMTGYLSQSGSVQLGVADFVTAMPNTAFMTTEICRIGICVLGDVEEIRELSKTRSANEIEAPPEEMPTCAKANALQPGRLKFSFYGYTWGDNWADDVSGENYLLLRLKLCFTGIGGWSVNGAPSGTEILDRGVNVSSIEVRQSDGATFIYRFPKFYQAGQHLNCSFADLTWNLPKWECMHAVYRHVRVTASSASGELCLQEGLILTIAFDLQDLKTKDMWYFYGLDVNSGQAKASRAAPRCGAVNAWLVLLVIVAAAAEHVASTASP